MKRIDYNCFTGNWPFHKVRCNTIEKLWQTPVPGHLVYGSLAPLFELQSTALLVDTARIPTADREAIFCSNRLNDLLF